jgi:hypothetical protein
MPSKTNEDKIAELEKLGAMLVERVDNVRNEMMDRERLAIIEERLNEFKKSVEEATRRRSALTPVIVGAVAASVLTFLLTLLAQLILAHFKK